MSVDSYFNYFISSNSHTNSSSSELETNPPIDSDQSSTSRIRLSPSAKRQRSPTMSVERDSSKSPSKRHSLKLQFQIPPASPLQDQRTSEYTASQHRPPTVVVPPPPRRETFYLARPPGTNRSTSLALQLQRISKRNGHNGGSMAIPIYDIKQNTPPIKKFLKKVKSFNDAVTLIIPPHYHLHHHTPNDPLTPTKPRPSSIHIPTSPNSAPTFSIYDRDAPKDPVAQISQHGISFSQRTTPLLSRHTRLDRQESTHNHNSSLVGPVSWVVVEDRGGYKVLDKGTNMLIGKWRLQSTLGNSRRRSQLGNTYQVLGNAAEHDDRPFFSGSLLDGSADQDKTTWCFVVKGNNGNSPNTNTVIATLKGYELNILLQQSNTVEEDVPVFLDEFTKALRQKAITKALANAGNNVLVPSNASLASVLEESKQAGSSNGNDNSSSRLVALQKANRRHTLSIMTFPNLLSGGPTTSTPRPSSEYQHNPNQQLGVQQSPPVLAESIFEHSGSSFYRLHFIDGVIMCAMAVMLNLDENVRRHHSLSNITNAATDSSNRIVQDEDVVMMDTAVGGNGTMNNTPEKRNSLSRRSKRLSSAEPPLSTIPSAVVEDPVTPPTMQRKGSLLKRGPFLKLKSLMGIKTLPV